MSEFHREKSFSRHLITGRASGTKPVRGCAEDSSEWRWEQSGFDEELSRDTLAAVHIQAFPFPERSRDL